MNCDVTEHDLCGFYMLLETTFGAESISGDSGPIYCEFVNLEREATVTFEM